MHQEETDNANYGMERSIFTMHRSLHWWETHGIERCEERLLKVCLLQRDRDVGPSCRKKNCIKIHLADMNQYLGLNIVLKALFPCLLLLTS